jgi:hypothetical protein
MGADPLLSLQANSKIQIYGGNVIVAATGAVGLSQRLTHHIEQAISGGVFKGSKHDCTTNISKRLLTDCSNSLVQNHPQQGLRFGALLAATIKGEPCLVEYATTDFQPEIKDDKAFFASMGSGQILADPFLAFVSRVLWKGAMPTVDDGRFGVYWVLDHTIKLAVGGVRGPIKPAGTVATLTGMNSYSAVHNRHIVRFPLTARTTSPRLPQVENICWSHRRVSRIVCGSGSAMPFAASIPAATALIGSGSPAPRMMSSARRASSPRANSAPVPLARIGWSQNWSSSGRVAKRRHDRGCSFENNTREATMYRRDIWRLALGALAVVPVVPAQAISLSKLGSVPGVVPVQERKEERKEERRQDRMQEQRQDRMQEQKQDRMQERREDR